jgi:hypothetical protein
MSAPPGRRNPGVGDPGSSQGFVSADSALQSHNPPPTARSDWPGLAALRAHRRIAPELDELLGESSMVGNEKITWSEVLDVIHHAFVAGMDYGLALGRNGRTEDEALSARHAHACQVVGLEPFDGPPLWSVTP